MSFFPLNKNSPNRSKISPVELTVLGFMKKIGQFSSNWSSSSAVRTRDTCRFEERESKKKMRKATPEISEF